MSSNLSIQYLRYDEIDKQLWDACIDRADNGLIYGKSYYLDTIAHHWDGIVVGNYAAVLPLPWNKKFTIRYVYPPPFCQQLGLFSFIPLDHFICEKVMQKAVEAFKFGEYYCNYWNKISPATAKNNFILNLNIEYATIAKNYQQHLQKNLKKAQRYYLHYDRSDDYSKAIRMYQEAYGNRMPHVRKEDYERLLKVCSLLHNKAEVIVREVKDGHNNLLSIALCLKDSRRIYWLLPTTTTMGRTRAATHFLIDNMIREFSLQPLLLDFEGSDIPGIARFYKDFGSSNQPYFFYRWNRLPWPFKVLKENTNDLIG